MPATIVFAHANGFPAACYQTLFKVWEAAGWRVLAPSRLGHDARFPVNNNWVSQRDELLHFIDGQLPTATPVVLIGHSLGGLVSLQAACLRPALAQALILLDAPIITGWRAKSVGLMKAIGQINRFSPGRISKRRRQEWPDRAAVLKHFASKPHFARWHPQVLQDYVDCGFEEHDGKLCLSFRRDVETRIYDTLPHHLGRLLRHQAPRCPVGFLAGRASEEMRLAGSRSSQSLAGEYFQWVEGSHLFPFEQPEATAQGVLALLNKMPPRMR